MTPAARIAAAIEILDTILAGRPAEQTLTNWGRANRFAGSKDRAAIRDHVFDGLRRRRSSGLRAGQPEGRESGRAILIGVLLSDGTDPDTLFTGDRYAPAPLKDAERAAAAAADTTAAPDPMRLDFPDWLETELNRSLGSDLASVMAALQDRAPVFLRVNLLKTNRDAAARRLAGEGIATIAHPDVPTALIVDGPARGLRQTESFVEGWIELQDAASQATVEFAIAALQEDGQGAPPSCLDYCAGGGGKTIALAAQLRSPVTAHDIDPARMGDLPARAARAGAELRLVRPDALPGEGDFSLVLADAPCSGSGAWRRQADARWHLTPDRLATLNTLQAEVLDGAARHVATGGSLVYVTCSILACENEDQVTAFLHRHPDWTVLATRNWRPGPLGDGFFAAHLKR